MAGYECMIDLDFFFFWNAFHSTLLQVSLLQKEVQLRLPLVSTVSVELVACTNVMRVGHWSNSTIQWHNIKFNVPSPLV
jgi:hypothetical protein